MTKIKLAFLSKVDLSPHLTRLLVTSKRMRWWMQVGEMSSLRRAAGIALRDRVKILVN